MGSFRGGASPFGEALVGRPVITSGTVVSTPLLPASATRRTTSAIRSGSHAMSVRIEKVPTSVHSPGGRGGSIVLSADTAAPVAGSTNELSVGGTGGGEPSGGSPGGVLPVSVGQVHWSWGKSSCSATARKLRLAPSMDRVTGVAWPVRRTISAACRSAAAVGENPAPSTESARSSN